MSRQKRRTEIGENFISYPRSMLESPVFRALSHAATRVMHRIEIEHLSHGGAENGRLQVTTDQFAEWGVCRRMVAPAIRELAALGFIEVTEHGHAGAAGFGRANRFRLTYVNCKSREEPTHEWRRIETIEIAMAIVVATKREKSQRARELGRRSWAARKENLGSRKGTDPVHESELNEENFSSRKGTTRLSSRKGTTIYNLGGDGARWPQLIPAGPRLPLPSGPQPSPLSRIANVPRSPPRINSGQRRPKPAGIGLIAPEGALADLEARLIPNALLAVASVGRLH